MLSNSVPISFLRIFSYEKEQMSQTKSPACRFLFVYKALSAQLKLYVSVLICVFFSKSAVVFFPLNLRFILYPAPSIKLVLSLMVHSICFHSFFTYTTLSCGYLLISRDSPQFRNTRLVAKVATMGHSHPHPPSPVGSFPHHWGHCWRWESLFPCPPTLEGTQLPRAL